MFEKIYKSISSIEYGIDEDEVLGYALQVFFNTLWETDSKEAINDQLKKDTCIGFIKNFTQEKGLPSNKITCLYFDKPSNKLWVGTADKGICAVDMLTEKINNFNYQPNLEGDYINSITDDKAGNIWIASDYGNEEGDTLGGLWRSDLSTSNIDEKTFTKITNKEVFFMLEDKDNNIWLGTRGTGLYRFNGKTFDSFCE